MSPRRPSVHAIVGSEKAWDSYLAEASLERVLAEAVGEQRDAVEAQLRIKLGVAYVGLLDEVAIFDRALSEAEGRALHALPRGGADLR